jgi:hypothetical protein
MGLGRRDVSSESRVPYPPAKITTFILNYTFIRMTTQGTGHTFDSPLQKADFVLEAGLTNF